MTHTPDVAAALHVPAQLWFGHQDVLRAKACELLQKIFCPQGCGVCSTCMKIVHQQHHAIAWFVPEKQYVVEQIDEVLERLGFSLEPNSHCFLVLERADTLTPATANRLLKSLEEPPPGYHFLLLADRAHGILPTIKSRCITKSWEEAGVASTFEPVISLFFAPHPNPATFLAQLEQTPIPEHQTFEVLDNLLERYLRHRKSEAVTVLTQAFEHPPMPGSSKLFWKNLYLQLTQ